VIENNIETIVKRLNASNMLTAVLKATGPVEIRKSELENILKYQKPEDLQDFTAIDTYMDSYMDYIKENGGYVQLNFDSEKDLFTFTLMSKGEAESKMSENESIGYVCVRSRWNDYAHS
jgi:transcription antitermination factor NusG